MSKSAGIIFASLLILLALILGVYLYTRPNEAASKYDIPSEPPGKGIVGTLQNDSDPFDMSITYKDDGFHPSDITVNQGTRIRFLNESSQKMWPASGIHPTHTLYPEKESTDCLGSSFDSCKKLGKGEFFDFTFYYPGTWRFHDHVHPYDTGAITVVATSTIQQ